VRQHKLDDRSLVRALAAHAPGKWLASGAHNGEVRVWNWEDGKTVASFTASPP
jgi:WD40 repeat protein